MKFLFLALLILVGCGKKDETKMAQVFTPNFIVKDNFVTWENEMEATPFIWTDGRVLHMMANRNLLVPSADGRILIYDGNTLVSSTPTTIALSSALMVGTKLVVIGMASNQLMLTETTDLITWSPLRAVLPVVAGRSIYNNSFTQLPNGSFVMAYETCEAHTKCFNARFATSTDLVTWTEAGTIFKPGEYAACPTIRFVNGKYYVFWLKYVGHYATYVSRSDDLINWEDSSKVVLSALKTEGESINNSDFDFVENNGELIMNYAVGDQKTHSHIKLARYQGTLVDFLAEFFPN